MSSISTSTVQLQEIVETIFTGLVLTRAISHENGTPTRVVRVQDVGTRLPGPDALEVLNLDPLRDFDRYRVQERDIILTARGTVVRAAVVEPAQSGAVAGPNLIVIRPQPDLEPDLLAAYLRHPSMQTRLLAQRVGSVTLGFTTSQVAALKIAVPVLAHQQHLAQLVRLADAYYEKASQAAMARRDLVADLVLGVLHPHAERSADA